MEETFFADKELGPENLRQGVLPKGEYDGSKFTQLDLSGADLSGYSFLDCQFLHCNLGNMKLQGTAMKSVSFQDCKLTGLQFTDCHPFLFAVSFTNCRLEYASFHGKSMKGTKFIRCDLTEVDFTEADLTRSIFEDCGLGGSQFNGANLERVDLRTSEGFMIDPRTTKLKKAMFRLSGLPGLLTAYDIIIEP
jgi:fluoroquinolone resistance protein